MSVTISDPKAAARALWGGAAQGWDAWFEWYTRNFAPVMDWCCDAAGLKAGDRLLDVACGSGQPALTAARRLQPGGSVVATDLAPEMLAVARRRADQAGLRNIEFREMDAEHLQLDDASFDAVTCAYCLMFCPDVERAVSEARRVLKRGGRFACVVWDDPAKSPFLTVAGGSVAKFFPAQTPGPNTPGAFRFAQPGTLAALLEASGFTEVSVQSVPMMLECASIDEYWRMFTDVAAGIKGKVAMLGEEDRARLREIVEAAAAPYVEDGRLRLVATSLCARGIRF